MNNEIMQVIIEYGEKGKKIDSGFFSRILEIYFRAHGISGFVDSNIILDKYTECPFLAYLDPKHRKIKVFVKSILEYKKFIKDEYRPIFTLEELGMFFRISLAQIILHEAEHAVQEYARVNNDYSTPDKKLLHATEYNFKRTLDKMLSTPFENIPSKEEICAVIDNEIALYRKINDENRDLDLKERLAQIKSFKNVCKIVTNLDLSPNFFKFFSSEVSRNQIRGYKLKGSFATGPTLEFIDILAQNDLVDTSISEYWHQDKNLSIQRAMSDFSFEERINLGLPITLPEFNQKNEEAIKNFHR